MLSSSNNNSIANKSNTSLASIIAEIQEPKTPVKDKTLRNPLREILAQEYPDKDEDKFLATKISAKKKSTANERNRAPLQNIQNKERGDLNTTRPSVKKVNLQISSSGSNRVQTPQSPYKKLWRQPGSVVHSLFYLRRFRKTEYIQNGSKVNPA